MPLGRRVIAQTVPLMPNTRYLMRLSFSLTYPRLSALDFSIVSSSLNTTISGAAAPHDLQHTAT